MQNFYKFFYLNFFGSRWKIFSSNVFLRNLSPKFSPWKIVLEIFRKNDKIVFSLFFLNIIDAKKIYPTFLLWMQIFFFSFLSESFIFQIFLIKILFHFFSKIFLLKSFLEIFVREQQKSYRKRKKIRSDPACGDRRIDRTFHSSWAPVN